MVFDKKALFAAIVPKTKTVTVEGFGEVILKELSVPDAEAFSKTVKKEDDAYVSGINLLIWSVVDKNGKRVFSADDLPALLNLAAGPIRQLATAASILNGYQKAPDAKN
jgi:hypothetical protein